MSEMAFGSKTTRRLGSTTRLVIPDGRCYSVVVVFVFFVVVVLPSGDEVDC
jgi:hypothetical protein